MIEIKEVRDMILNSIISEIKCGEDYDQFLTPHGGQVSGLINILNHNLNLGSFSLKYKFGECEKTYDVKISERK